MIVILHGVDTYYTLLQSHPMLRSYMRCHDVFLWFYVWFVLLRFRLYAVVEAATLRSIVLRYAGAPIATRVSFFLFPFLYLETSLFPSIFCTIDVFSLYGEYAVRSFLPDVFFYLVTTGWIFDIISLCENSINHVMYVRVSTKYIYTIAKSVITQKQSVVNLKILRG